MAKKIGRPGGSRAVGRACGANPLPLFIPCHRVLPKDGTLGGFSLGSLGPVSEGLFIWIFGIGSLIGLTVWITAKSN